jgi:hypothetical protein
MLTSSVRKVLDLMDYSRGEGLVTVDSAPPPPERSYVWQEVQDKFSLDAVYFYGNVPLVYFKGFETASMEDLFMLHRRLWNHNRAPVLVVVLPEEVRVFNCFASPQRSAEVGAMDSILLGSIKLSAEAIVVRQRLLPYSRQEVISGRLARNNPTLVDHGQRVDRRLLANLGDIRTSLLNQNLDEHSVNSLLGRSIFIRYLEDRGILSPGFLEKQFGAQAYSDLLQRSKERTYELFSFLADKFNGDLFPVSADERKAVSRGHLRDLSEFLRGSDVKSGQLYFWAYDFDCIPIELISSIYEEFLQTRRESTSSFYTPYTIVDFVLNEALPWAVGGTPSILDPACGSGIFLVEAYRRLVERWRRDNAERPSVSDLRNILTSSIFGIDISEEAVRVAAFSCYLAMLDFVEPKRVWAQAKLPKLIGTNLFVADFFDKTASFNTRRFSVIVSNPPWQSRLTENAQKFVSESSLPIGDIQIAQAFLWKTPELLEDGGRACFLVPSKSVLFNRGAASVRFRERFLATHDVYAVVNFSPFRRRLFQNATSPMAAIFFRKGSERQEGGEVRYATPRPSPLGESMAGVVLAGDEIHRFSRRQVVKHPDIWKIALWGTARDFSLVEDLRSRFATFEKFRLIRGWSVGQGFIGGHGKQREAPQLRDMEYIPVEALHPFRVAQTGQRLTREAFERPRQMGVYRGPHVLARRGLVDGKIAAKFFRRDAVFSDGIIGIGASSDDEVNLKVLCAYLNSSLARYYFFLTGSSWGIERDEIKLVDYLSLPVALPLPEETTSLIAEFVERVQDQGALDGWLSELDQLVFAAYGLTTDERNLVTDTVTTTIGQFYQGIHSDAFQSVTPEELIAYAETFAGVFRASSVGQRVLRAIVGTEQRPYRLVSFYWGVRESDSEDLTARLQRLETLAFEQSSSDLFLQRNIRIFEHDAFHLAKPDEKRYWTRTAALNDADETISQLMRAAQAP